MKKQTRRFGISYPLDWAYGVEISKLKEDLEEIEKLGATHVDIDIDTYYDCSSISIEAFVTREETDEEMQKRVKEEQATIEESKRRDLQLLENLKAKYGK